ncbi:flagellar basal body-associated protein FliL [Larsenimonas salina]|uniref:flagellar basal body-associated protein FliL n=1 Tax=Larsenimonas salina TaxID=1295565 RepID=UPI0020747E0B|nr:flagellar basal body-associated protein FliL [Larsenimonas salina]MCM5703715.1 flagellar basal body-associated protein FliL [Larsenimonas salina]
MAKAKVKTASSDDAPNKKSKLWLIVLLSVLVTAGAAAGVYYFLLADDAPSEEVTEQAPPPPPPTPVFVELKPFTVNLGDNSGRMLYVGISLRVESAEAQTHMLEHMPEVRNRILLVLTSQDSKELATLEGKRQLASTISQAFDQPFEGAGQPITVSDVLFTDFIVQ